MPLTDFQQAILAVLAQSRVAEGYLAGGSAIHIAPHSARYSDDLDFFHDTEARVAAAFAGDRDVLSAQGFQVDVVTALPGYIRATVSRGSDSTRIDWAHDSAWRFMPLVRGPFGGLQLHPVDLAINKLLAVAGRNEVRDYVDILYAHEHILPIAGLVWGAVGKDPGFSPDSLLDLLQRRGRYRPEDLSRLQLAAPFDLEVAKQTWLAALDDADQFVRTRPSTEYGALYYSVRGGKFVIPSTDQTLAEQGVVPHFGTPGGVIPQLSMES